MHDELPRCIIADDHPAIRAALRLRIEGDGVARIVGEAETGQEAIELMRTERLDVAVLDMRMPLLTGMEVCTRARGEGITTPIVMLTAVTARHAMASAMDAGIEGFVSKETPLDVLVDAVRAVLAGGRYIDPTLASTLLDPDDQQLTTRELAVLELMGQGLQNKVIAAQLDIGSETVKAHVSSIMKKLGATSRTEAVVRAMRMSLINP